MRSTFSEGILVEISVFEGVRGLETRPGGQKSTQKTLKNNGNSQKWKFLSFPKTGGGIGGGIGGEFKRKSGSVSFSRI